MKEQWPAIVEKLQGDLVRHRGGTKGAEAEPLTPQEEEALKALGYIE